MQTDAVINKVASFENPPGCFDTPTILDDASPVPPSANIHEADKVLPSRRVHDEIVVDPKQPQIQVEEHIFHP